MIELSERERIRELLSADARSYLEALDESARGIDGIVSIFCPEEPAPANWMLVRWAQADLGLRNVAQLHATRLTDLAEVIEALPEGRGEYELSVPFWAAPFAHQRTEGMRGAEAIYFVGADALQPSPVEKQCELTDDLSLLSAKFRKLVEGQPAAVLSMKGQLAAVAVVTHLDGPHARLTVFTPEEWRGRGFGRGVVTALSRSLIAAGLEPSLRVPLSDERAVRLVESAGFRQHSAALSLRLSNHRRPAPPPGPGLVQLGGR